LFAVQVDHIDLHSKQQHCIWSVYSVRTLQLC
jgi:hypothetical protein